MQKAKSKKPSSAPAKQEGSKGGRSPYVRLPKFGGIIRTPPGLAVARQHFQEWNDEEWERISFAIRLLYTELDSEKSYTAKHLKEYLGEDAPTLVHDRKRERNPLALGYRVKGLDEVLDLLASDHPQLLALVYAQRHRSDPAAGRIFDIQKMHNLRDLIGDLRIALHSVLIGIKEVEAKEDEPCAPVFSNELIWQRNCRVRRGKENDPLARCVEALARIWEKHHGRRPGVKIWGGDVSIGVRS